jgi:PAS domain S-box-containing protein
MADALLQDEARTREQLLEEVRALRRRLHALERANRSPAAGPAVAPEGFLTLLLDHSPAPIYVTSADDRYLLVNRAWEEFFRLRREDVLGRPLAEVVPRESAVQLSAVNRRVLQTGAPVTTEEFADGACGRRFFHTVKFPLCGPDGRVEAVGGISVDVTERRDAEEALRQASGLVHAVSEGINDTLFVKDRAGRYLMMNSAGALRLGKSLAEVLGQGDASLFAPETAERILADDRRVIASGRAETFEETILSAGTRRAYLTTKAPYRDARGEVQGVLGIARDITEQKRAEGLLEVQRQVLERVSTDAPLAEVLEVLARAIEGQSPGTACSVLLLEEDGVTLRHGAAPSLPAEYCRAVDGIAIGPAVGSCGTAAYLGQPVVVEDIATDPLWTPYRQLALPHGLRACWSTPILCPAGKVLGTFAVYYREPRGPDAYDLQLVGVSTHLAALAIERKRAAAALRQSEARFQAFMDHSPAVAWTKDERLRIVYVNRTWEHRFRRTLAEVRGLTDLDFRPPEVGERLREHDRQVLATGQALALEEVVPDPDGRLRYWQAYKFPFGDAAGNRYVGGMAVDITERKKAEEERRAYTERLEALSRRVLEAQEAERRHLARELHDEFGQLLTGISLNLRAIRAGLGAEARPWLEESIAAVAEAIRQTRNFSLDLRPSILDDFGLGAALRWCAERQAQRAGLAVELETDLPGERPPAHVETACFRIAQEALTNVVRHARARRVRVEAKRRGPEIHIRICDDGVGFDLASVRAEAVEAGGFGLLGMQDRARLVGGQIAVESRPGGGTRIQVRIPLAPAEEPVEAGARQP